YCICVFGATGDIDEIGTINARREYHRRYGRNLTDGYIIMDHWRDGLFNLRPALVVLSLDSLLFLCILLAASLGLRTLHCISHAITLSAYSRYLQHKLLIMLIVQTALPVVLVYIPYFCILTIPYLGIPDHGLTAGCTAFNSGFPTWDALVIIFFMKDYRDALGKLFRMGLRREAT
ncbi:hypothetical protein PFISCL1PPCAC_13444, partial [Pristionchus fissidentatus]